MVKGREGIKHMHHTANAVGNILGSVSTLRSLLDLVDRYLGHCQTFIP